MSCGPWSTGCCAEAAKVNRSTAASAKRRTTTAPEYGSGCGGDLQRAAGLGQLALEFRRWRVAVVDVECRSLARHHHCRRKRVHVKTVGKSALSDRVHLVDTHVAKLGERRLLVSAAHGASVAGEVKDVRLARRSCHRTNGPRPGAAGSEELQAGGGEHNDAHHRQRPEICAHDARITPALASWK